MISFIRTIKNIIKCNGWSFWLSEYSVSIRVALQGQDVLISGTIKNDYLHLVYETAWSGLLEIADEKIISALKMSGKLKALVSYAWCTE